MYYESVAQIQHTMSNPGAQLPSVVYLDLGDFCNLKCFFCDRAKYEVNIGGKGGFVSIDKLRMLERALRAAKYVGLSSGIGEPLLYPKLDELARWLYEINPSVLLRIVTNGTTLNRDKAALFAGHLDFLSISLNAGNAKAYFRDVHPEQYSESLNWIGKWNAILQRISEFIEALPSEDRRKVRIQSVVHRDNIQDMLEFIRVVASLGCTHAVITPMRVHDEDKMSLSVFLLKDTYNEIIEECMALGSSLGVRVEAARFFSTLKPELNLETACRDPFDIAYINNSVQFKDPGVGKVRLEKGRYTAPCCHWAEDAIPMDVYSDIGAFERFWNGDVFQRLRAKRDFKSCQTCGLTRVFDNVLTHFSPSLRLILTRANRIVDAEKNDVYEGYRLVRACHAYGLDLPSLRRTVRRLRLPFDLLDSIEDKGSAALPQIDAVCWKAFIDSNPPFGSMPVNLAGNFAGIGWGEPLHEPNLHRSSRWLHAGNTGSIFVRAEPGSTYEARILVCRCESTSDETLLQLFLGERPLCTQSRIIADGSHWLAARVPKAWVNSHRGCLWLRVVFSPKDMPSPPVALSVLRLDKLALHVVVIERLTASLRCVGAGAANVAAQIVEFVWRRPNRCWYTMRNYVKIIKADPAGSIPRIKRRLATMVGIRS